MNIQIFGSKKDNDTKKAQRFFKERGIRFQYIELREKTLSKGEFRTFAMADRRHWDISWELSNITFAGTVTRCMQMRMAKNVFCSQKLICSHWDMIGNPISESIPLRLRRRRAKSPFTAVGAENVPTS